MNCLIFVMFAFWVPQIIQNVKSGQKHAVQDSFLFGVTAIRLFFPLYVFGCPNNFLEFETNMYMVVGLMLFASCQVLTLKAQDKWGSRFLLPKWLQPDYYDYHQTFYPDDNETCAICMADIISSTEDPLTINNNVEQVKTEYIARNVLTTPCNHRFCEECLVQWMESKMICPMCRRMIPPYNT